MVFVLAVRPVREEVRDIAVGHFRFDAAAVQIQGGAGHAEGPENALFQEILQGLSAHLVRDARQQRERFVAVAHVFARLAQRRIGAFADIADDILDLVELVRARPAQILVVLIVLARRVHGDGPIQALVERNARPVQRQLAQRDEFVRNAGDVQIRQEVRRRLVQIQNAFRVQDAKGQRRKGFAERSDAEHRVRKDRQTGPDAALSEPVFEQHAFRSADADRDAGTALFFDFFLQRLFERFCISIHRYSHKYTNILFLFADICKIMPAIYARRNTRVPTFTPQACPSWMKKRYVSERLPVLGSTAAKTVPSQYSSTRSSS